MCGNRSGVDGVPAPPNPLHSFAGTWHTPMLKSTGLMRSVTLKMETTVICIGTLPERMA
eukprot:gene14360-biopygen16809